jgi:deoxyribonuclease V
VRAAISVHSFAVTIPEAIEIQKELSSLVDVTDAIDSPEGVKLVGGVDVAFISTAQQDSITSLDSSDCITDVSRGISFEGEPDVLALACIVIMDVKQHQVVEKVFATAPVLFPYIPGLLSFREGPAVLAAFKELSAVPDAMVFDGSGIAHPRDLGLASHMAVLMGIPSIGCAKSLLIGTCDEPGLEKGDWSYIYNRKRVVGTCLRTRRGVKPMYISPGSGFSVDGACRFALMLTGKYRLPEPTRMAHYLVTEQKGLMVRGDLERFSRSRGW